MKTQKKDLNLCACFDLHIQSLNVHIINENERKCDSCKVIVSEGIRKYFGTFKGYKMKIAEEVGNPTFRFCDILEKIGFGMVTANTLEYCRTANNKKEWYAG